VFITWDIFFIMNLFFWLSASSLKCAAVFLPWLISLFCLFAGCVLVVSVIEQLAMFHNCTAKEAIERLCNYLPEILNLQGICYLVAELYGPELIKLLMYKLNADVVCHSMKLCKQNEGRPFCHLYPPPKVSYAWISEITKNTAGYSSICALPVLTLRGYHWRGRDCNEGKGVDPKDGIPYEKKFCKGKSLNGIILLGDSAGAHFHIPPEWMTAAQMSLKSFSDLQVALTNELDWPHFSGTTGFLNSTIGGWTDSLYLRLRRRNRCNHRDFQNISKNGTITSFFLARNQLLDNPAIVIYASIGNDVCNGPDTVAHMTTPNQMHSNVMQTLQYLNSQLPKGSHVILTGLVDGRFLWDQLHSRYHPLGQLNKDITYEQMYSFLSCLQISPCNGWMSSNETLRNLTSERALQLSNVLKEIARSEMFANFDIFYMDFPLGKIVDEWHKLGGESWQLIEPADGFHPSQVKKNVGKEGQSCLGFQRLMLQTPWNHKFKSQEGLSALHPSKMSTFVFPSVWRTDYKQVGSALKIAKGHIRVPNRMEGRVGKAVPPQTAWPLPPIHRLPLPAP
uniref:Acyloxyacyl hydrolase n=1 Tax=Chelonoidis abingdonii TaxID=106734 RepID=A0A8C0GA20_CHEAB